MPSRVRTRKSAVSKGEDRCPERRQAFTQQSSLALRGGETGLGTRLRSAWLAINASPASRRLRCLGSDGATGYRAGVLPRLSTAQVLSPSAPRQVASLSQPCLDSVSGGVQSHSYGEGLSRLTRHTPLPPPLRAEMDWRCAPQLPTTIYQLPTYIPMDRSLLGFGLARLEF